MSEDKKNLGDKAEDAFEKAKDKAEEFAGEAKEKAGEFKEEAKKTAEEFKEGLKDVTSTDNKKILAGILAIVLGWLGIHKFILGYTQEGIIMAVVSIVGWFLCGIPTSIVALIGLVEGILYLTKSDEEFYNTYQAGRKPWF